MDFTALARALGFLLLILTGIRLYQGGSKLFARRVSKPSSDPEDYDEHGRPVA